MRKHHSVVCICLGGLVLLAGCTGAEPGPRQLPPQTVQRVEDVQRVEAAPPSDRGHELAPAQAGNARDTGPAAEPREIAAEAAKAPPAGQEAAESNEAEPATSNEVIDPNDMKTAPADDAVEPQTPPSQGPVEPNHPAPDEPDEAPATVVEPNESAPDEPGETIVVEPNESAVGRGQAAALPAFVEGYARLLHDYVHEDGAVDYGSLHRRRLDVRQLLMRLDELDPNAYAAWPDSGKLAFWINAYNLKMLDIILRNYPIESSWWLRLTWPPSDIRHIQGIWTDYKFVVMEEEFTLAEVERRFFHRTFNDPRVYLAVTYASRSGPALRGRPYDGDTLDRQLDEQVKAFLTAGQHLRIDRREMVVHLSALFKPAWRGKEFVARYGTDKKFKDRDPETRAVLSFLTKYLSRDDAYFLETENYKIEYTNFDWRLNDTSRGY